MKYIGLIFCAAVMTSLTDARSKRSVGVVTLKASPRVAVQGVTEEIRIECKPAANVKNVLMAVLIHLEKVGDNGTVNIVASQRINALQLAENNRTSATGHLQADKEDKESHLSVTITDPILEDDGIYQCRFAYIDVTLSVHVLGAKVNVTVSELPVPHFVQESECNCDDIWSEIEQLKTALAERKSEPAQLASPYDEKCRSSFSARFAERHGYAIYGDTTAVFDKVISNKGNNYNTDTGVFTTPCDGQYFFTASLRSHQSMDSGYVDGVITVDGEAKARTSVFLAHPVDNYQSASNGVVLSLKAGQEVKVVVLTTSSGEFVGDEYSVFSGFFLYP